MDAMGYDFFGVDTTWEGSKGDNVLFVVQAQNESKHSNQLAKWVPQVGTYSNPSWSWNIIFQTFRVQIRFYIEPQIDKDSLVESLQLQYLHYIHLLIIFFH